MNEITAILYVLSWINARVHLFLVIFRLRTFFLLSSGLFLLFWCYLRRSRHKVREDFCLLQQKVKSLAAIVVDIRLLVRAALGGRFILMKQFSFVRLNFLFFVVVSSQTLRNKLSFTYGILICVLSVHLIVGLFFSRHLLSRFSLLTWL